MARDAQVPCGGERVTGVEGAEVEELVEYYLEGGAEDRGNTGQCRCCCVCWWWWGLEIAVWRSTCRLNSRSYQDGLGGGGGGGDYDVGQKEERQTTRTRGTIVTLKMILHNEIIVHENK